MNICRLAGDLFHLLAIIILLLKIWKTRSCAGISGKSQILFCVVYVSRFLDLFTAYVSLYNSMMKVVFIGASGAIIYLMYVKFKATNDANHDPFRIEILLISCVLLSLVVNHEFTLMEVLWTFSIYLESVAILPQLFLVSKIGESESLINYYLIALGSYRALYLLNWVSRYIMESYYDLIPIFSGILQTILFCGFFLFPAKPAAKRVDGETGENMDEGTVGELSKKVATNQNGYAPVYTATDDGDADKKKKEEEQEQTEEGHTTPIEFFI